MRFYSAGKCFWTFTDHKAIEELKRKKEFGFGRIHRWFERLERFQFRIKYRKGKEMIVSDSLSRAQMISDEEDGFTTKILKAHCELSHRKNILNDLKKRGFTISNELLTKILSECLTCKMKDKEQGKTCEYVKVEAPGDKIGIDILEVTKGDRILMAIDYFSRKLFAKQISTKKSRKIVNFLEEIYKEFPFKTMTTDNGKEFDSKEVLEWTKTKGVKHNFSIPHYHQSNGRIERANRTFRNALKKTHGSTKLKLKKVISNYNNLNHRALGCSPEEAIRKENFLQIKEREEKYRKEFKNKRKKEKRIYVGDEVLLRNEMKTNKMDDEYCGKATVISKESENVYRV